MVTSGLPVEQAASTSIRLWRSVADKDAILAARGVGIIAVVMGHIGHFYPMPNVYYWHIPLFFFLVGSSVLHRRTWRQTVRHVLVDTLLYLFAWTAIYLAMIYALWPLFGQTRYLGENQTPLMLATIDVVKFNSHAVGFLAPCWFLLAYAMVTICCTPFARIIPRYGLAPAGVLLFALGWQFVRPEGYPLGDWLPNLLGQTFIGSGFCLIGAAFFAYPHVHRWLLHPAATLAAILVAGVTLQVWRPLPINISFMSLDPNALATVTVALSGIQVALFCSAQLSSLAWLRKLGRESKAIMTHQLLGFGIIGLGFALIGKLTLHDLAAYTVYEPKRYWPIYLAIGLILPLGIVSVSRTVTNRLRFWSSRLRTVLKPNRA